MHHNLATQPRLAPWVTCPTLLLRRLRSWFLTSTRASCMDHGLLAQRRSWRGRPHCAVSERLPSAHGPALCALELAGLCADAPSGAGCRRWRTWSCPSRTAPGAPRACSVRLPRAGFPLLNFLLRQRERRFSALQRAQSRTAGCTRALVQLMQ